MFPISYRGGGLFSTQEEWRHPYRRIDTYELVYGMAGCACIEEDGRRFEIHAGEALLLSPGRLHGGWRSSQGETSFYWVHFSLPDGQTPAGALGLSPGPLLLPDGYTAASYFRQLLHAANTPHYPDYAVAGALLTLLGELSYAQSMAPGSANRIAAQAAEWIRIHSYQKITVSQAAGQFGYHPDYLSALFRRAYGCSLGQYISEQRLLLAKNLLLTTDDPIQRIAERMGFSSANQFHHFFHHHEEMSPSRYRQQFSNTHWNNR